MNAIAAALPLARGLPLLLASSDDPHADLLAMIWGPRFDRAHALELLARRSAEAPVQMHAVLAGIVAAAEGYDAMSMRQQHRVRRIVLRHRARCDNAPCLASS